VSCLVNAWKAQVEMTRQGEVRTAFGARLPTLMIRGHG